jgi:hypothetical protein
MSRRRAIILLSTVAGLCTSCGFDPAAFTAPDIETEIAFVNFHASQYAALGFRTHAADPQAPFAMTALLPPGGVHRARFLNTVGTGCPNSLDFQVFLYQRTNEDVPIGLDEGEAVDQAPIAAGEILALPACDVQPLAVYTVVVWDSQPGVAHVRIAQNTPVDQAIADAGRFDNADNTWDVTGVDPALADEAPPPLAEMVPIAGRLVDQAGAGVVDVGVLIRTRFRVEPGMENPDDDDPNGGFSDPIDFRFTDASGLFRFDRPAGAYMVELFSDDYAFRPAFHVLETPAAAILVTAEPIE